MKKVQKDESIISFLCCGYHEYVSWSWHASITIKGTAASVSLKNMLGEYGISIGILESSGRDTSSEYEPC